MGGAVRDTAIILLITALMMASVEIGVRIFAPQDLRTEYIEGGPLGLKDPVLGHVNRPNVHAHVRAPEFKVEYVVDSRGFRANNIQENNDGSDAATKILLIGDSFTFGAANQYDEIWAVKLSQLFKENDSDVEIINAGVPGYSTAQQALFLERIFDDIRPDYVVVMYLPNDLFANEPIEKSDDNRELATGDASAVIGRGSKKSSLHSVTLLKRLLMNNDRLYSNLYKMTPRREYFETPVSDHVSHKIQATASIFDRIHQFCEERNSKLVVVSVPQLFQVIEQASTGANEENLDVSIPDARIRSLLADKDIVWISALDALSAHYAAEKQDLYHRYDGHLNALGNDVMARLIYDELHPLLDS
jgi:lysophospholipase L1-like esterase